MQSSWRLTSSILIILLCAISTSWAETRYVSDQLVVSLREQPQNNSATVVYLKTDAAVEVLEVVGEFIKARTKEGEIGYLPQKYLTSTTPKTITIDKLRQERDRLAAKVKEIQEQAASTTSQSSRSQQELAAQVSDLNQEISVLKEKLIQSQAELKKTIQDYTALQNDAKEVIAITAERDQLLKTNQQLSAEKVALDQEVASLTRTGVIKWFLAGAGVLLFGWIIGKASRSRRRSMF